MSTLPLLITFLTELISTFASDVLAALIFHDKIKALDALSEFKVLFHIFYLVILALTLVVGKKAQRTVLFLTY
jgi:hypothetical protein